MRNSQAAFRIALVATTSLTLAYAPAALAQAVASPADTEAGTAETAAPIVVTGSRVKRDGFAAPTPETVLSSAEIEAEAPTNIADFVNELPALTGSSTPRTATINISSGSSGSNFLNLRGLGNNRTLVLLNGQRVVGANSDLRVDINVLPSALVQRVDVVTGGASAAWGSDAVSGVANFVLDTGFKGLKASIQSGITTYGDGREWRADLSGGTTFAEGRGHALLSISHSDASGITETTRPWFRHEKIVSNPAFVAGNGQPTLVRAENVQVTNGTPGGIITSGVLRGTVFEQGGAYRAFQYGTLAGSQYAIGGETNDLAGQVQLEIPLKNTSVYGRLAYDFSDAFKLHADVIYSKAVANSITQYNFNYGNLTIQRDNAFLPDALRTRLVAAGQSSFSYGITPADMGRTNPRNGRELQRYSLGASGDLGHGWSYDVYGQYGRVNVTVDVYNLQNNTNFRRAIDAVRNAAGQIVCRVNLTTVTDAACVPYNPFGIGVNGLDAIAYVSGTASLRQKIEQGVVAASVQGTPFSTWAGDVSVVAGGEYRKESISSTVDAISLASGWAAGNYKPTIGSYNVKEFFGETVIPLAENLPFARKLELNAAARRTDYSTSGGVTTWKVGGSWEPVAGLRFRSTVSRDIRAPNLSDLYSAGVTSAGQTILDRTTGLQTNNITGITVGNTAVRPEVANGLTAGFVFQPTFVPGLNLSFDYYNIRIKDAIFIASTQQVYDRCVGGVTAFCDDIIRNPAGVITTVYRRPKNFASERARGFDIEARYTTELDNIFKGAGGRLAVRALFTRFITRTLYDGVTLDESAGENAGSIPRWRLVTSMGYNSDRFDAQVTARSVSSGVFDVAYTTANIADNRLPGATFFDLNLTFKTLAFTNGRADFFINVDNVFNRDPVIVPAQGQQFVNPGVNAAIYDNIGRQFRVGFRIKT